MRAEKIGGIMLSSYGSTNANNLITLPRNKNIVPETVYNYTYRRSADGTLLIDRTYRSLKWTLSYDYMTNNDFWKLMRVLRSDDNTVTPGLEGRITLFGIDVADFIDENDVYGLRTCYCTQYPSPKIIAWDYTTKVVAIPEQYETYVPIFGDISFTLENYEAV